MANVKNIRKSGEWNIRSPPQQDKERPDQRNALYVQLCPEALMDLKLKDGHVCIVWKVDYPDQKYEGIAWASSQKPMINYNVALIYENLRKRCGFSLQDRICISSGGLPRVAEVVCLSDISHELPDNHLEGLGEKDIHHWEWAVEESLVRAGHLFTGMQFEATPKRQKRRFKIVSINGNTNAIARCSTESLPTIRILSESETQGVVSTTTKSRLEVIGIAGIDSALEKLNKHLERFESRKRPQIPRKGQAILLQGPSGTGKTMIMQRIQDLGWGKTYRIDEKTKTPELREIFKEAKLHPSIILVDGLDSLVSKERSRTLTSVTDEDLVAELDKIADYQVLCIAATSKINEIPEILTWPGRFNRIISLQAPTVTERKQIIRSLYTESLISNDLVESLGDRTHSYVGKDLACLLDEAAGFANERIEELELEASDETCRIIQEDVDKALHIIRPSVMRDVILQTPKVRWEEIGGQEEVKKTLRKVFEHQDPEIQSRLGIVPPKGLLLYGPPGCSKTLSAQAMATEASMNFFAVKGAELLNMYVGESERQVREVFQKARAAAPAIIFFDEIESIGSKREGRSNGVNVLTTLLNEMDGIEALKDVTVLAATNQPEALDLALLRPGRFDKLLYVAPPDLTGRMSILRIEEKKRAFADSVDIEELARMTDGYSGAELVAICNEAASITYDDIVDTGGEFRGIGTEDFRRAIRVIKKQISPDLVKKYRDWASGMGVEHAGGLEEGLVDGVNEEEKSGLHEAQDAFVTISQKMESLSIKDDSVKELLDRLASALSLDYSTMS